MHTDHDSYPGTFVDDHGAGLPEYALLLALIALIVIGALTAIGGSISDVFELIRTFLPD